MESSMDWGSKIWRLAKDVKEEIYSAELVNYKDIIGNKMTKKSSS